MPTAKEIFSSLAEQLSQKRREELEQKSELLTDFKTSILDPVLDSGVDPKTAGGMARLYSQKRAEIKTRAHNLQGFGQVIVAALEEHHLSNLTVEIASEATPAETISATLGQVDEQAENNLDHLRPIEDENLPELLIDRKTKRVRKLDGQWMQFRGNINIGWEVLLTILDKGPKGATREDIIAAAKRGHSINPNVSTHVTNLRAVVERNPSKAEIIVLSETTEGIRYVAKVKVVEVAQSGSGNGQKLNIQAANRLRPQPPLRQTLTNSEDSLKSPYQFTRIETDLVVTLLADQLVQAEYKRNTGRFIDKEDQNRLGDMAAKANSWRGLSAQAQEAHWTQIAAKADNYKLDPERFMRENGQNEDVVFILTKFIPRYGSVAPRIILRRLREVRAAHSTPHSTPGVVYVDTTGVRKEN